MKSRLKSSLHNPYINAYHTQKEASASFFALNRHKKAAHVGGGAKKLQQWIEATIA
ncbi:hypothetical protein OH458_09760 [Vibrio sp. MarTm2]|uniref:hypothetical protein n=1 Tax=Vibrio sp. MarTm2 TaxID=2998831 RepID=UPI0022CD2C92|nr:hypothetical protein [Vibrio sp. MarTm2]MDA0128367.1 hypothetical protein [Vibrio sp. MarTm2]